MIRVLPRQQQRDKMPALFPSRVRHNLLALVLLSSVIGLAGCGRGAPPPPPPGDDWSAEPDPETFDGPKLSVTSSAFEHNGNYPVEYTCDGASASPPIEWSGAPEGTKSYALQVWHVPGPRDIKSYWVLFNIPADVVSLPKNSRGIGTEGLNGKGRQGYDPMCFKGPGRKKYHITVYALSADLKLAPDKATRTELLAALKDVQLAEGTLTFYYERQPRK